MTRLPAILSRLAGAPALALALALAPAAAPEAAAEDLRAGEVATLVKYRSETVEGVRIAYREAGDPADPVLLLLHGFPTSSHMFRDLIPAIAARWHVIAPDYPGFGASDMPPAAAFDYSFDTFARLMTALLDAKGVGRYAVYVMDYGAPVGFRMFAADPARVSALVIQNGNAYDEGLQAFWDPFRAHWADPGPETAAPLAGFLGIEGTKWQYTAGMQHPDRVSPDNWFHAQYLLDRPGNREIQLALFRDYGSNPGRYPEWQAAFRAHQPPALLMWGRNDPIFPEAGAHPYRQDLDDLEFHLLDTGHFALEEYGAEIAGRILALRDRIAG
ncbi:alpha/beta hydrolase [Paralimibaculum aggregatum]|uniref:Alpha/beta hydrolase n=1 Tax=Paralimibaculum aggregatum TaxID=3036245 RepID=A0ABQ6LLR3_9RHOB|nr:alpha/beta hydrolase [Limibaculum sp. NKW23]GMG84154.1 alpha/beta hydrolase [Limibaculum sp. NKW23]